MFGENAIIDTGLIVVKKMYQKMAVARNFVKVIKYLEEKQKAKIFFCVL